MATLSSVSTSLLHPHVPLDEPAHLTLGIASRHHARHELAVLLLGLAILLRTEGDDGKQVFHLREYPFFDHLTNLFVRGPTRILTSILRSRTQRKLDYFVTEVLRIGDSGRLFDLGQLLVEQFAIHELAGVGSLE